MKVAVLIPCYNEERTIGKIIKDFRREIPEANIYVYDNNSNDATSDIALANGATVRKEPRQGKGNVVRSMFRYIEADIYVMVDGDDTYPAEYVHKLIEPLLSGEADMVIGDRHSNGTYACANKRPFHNYGNHLVKKIINKLFNTSLQDIMTGYRAFNKKFVKNIPVLSNGFEIETEMTLHALDKKFLIKEIPIDYRDRPKGSISKLNTFKDGIKVIKTIFWVFKDYKPIIFFSVMAFIFLALGILVGIPVVTEFIKIRYVSKVPSAILAVGFVVLSSIFFICGFVLDTIVKQHREDYELMLNQFEESNLTNSGYIFKNEHIFSPKIGLDNTRDLL